MAVEAVAVSRSEYTMTFELKGSFEDVTQELELYKETHRWASYCEPTPVLNGRVFVARIALMALDCGCISGHEYCEECESGGE